MYGDDDLDSVLFGGSDSPDNGGFDPFQPGLGDSDGEDDESDGDIDSSVIRYLDNIDRRSIGTDAETEPNDHRPIPGTAGRTRTIGAGEERQRAAADSGDGQLRRVAAQRTGSVGPGAPGRERAEGVANSIQSAQQRIRADARIPLDDDERARAVKHYEEGHIYTKLPRTYQKQHITSPPSFEQCEFEAQLIGLKANTAGDWIVNLKVPAESDNEVMQLKHGYGLALQITVVRKRYGD